jgi:thiol:disulfide interchange protein DsbD
MKSFYRTDWLIPTARLIPTALAIGLSLAGHASSAVRVIEEDAHTDHLTLRLIAERAVVAPGDRVSVLLDEQIIPGWHTYWRNPGDAGLPTAIAWTLPAGADAGPIQWPIPVRISVGPLVDYGYLNHVALISDVHVPSTWPVGRRFPVIAKVTWLVCLNVCIPENHTFSLHIPSAAAGSKAVGVAGLFEAARADQPTKSLWPSQLSSRDGITLLTVSLPEHDARAVTAAAFFPAEGGVIDHAARQNWAIEHGALAIRAAKGDLPTPSKFRGIVVLDETVDGNVKHVALNFD